MQINSRIIILVFAICFLLLTSQDILASDYAQAEDSTSIVTTTEVGHTPDHLPSAFMVKVANLPSYLPAKAILSPRGDQEGEVL